MWSTSEGMDIAEHYVAHTRGGDRGLVEGEGPGWLWARLRAGFPNADALTLMPDHPHLVAPPGQSRRFERILRGFTARFGSRFDVFRPEPIRTPAILGRTVRYVVRNPVATRLVDDPWAWPWSTLRDVGGAIASPWMTRGALAHRIRRNPSGLLRYLTEGAPELAGFPPGGSLVALETCRAAVASCLRCPPDLIRRRGSARHLMVQLAYSVGAPRVREVARACAAAENTVRRLREQAHPALHAARICLADPRLLVHDVTGARPGTVRRGWAPAVTIGGRRE